MNIPISITQRLDGKEYEGTIEIGDNHYAWDLILGAPAKDILSGEVRGHGPEETRNLFRIKLRLNDRKVDLSDMEVFCFLMQTIVRFALDFYQEPQTREFNVGSLTYHCAGMHNKSYQHLIGDRQFEGMPSLSLSTTYKIDRKMVPPQLMA